MSSKSIEVPSGNTSSEFVHNELSNNDLDRPIALRKGVISCTKYPIYNFVSYKGLSPSFFGLLLPILPTYKFPTTYKKLSNYQNGGLLFREIQALEKNGIWEISEIPNGKKSS
ncbi:hypothetical protein CK203_008076 [Vitis vinifera]|uniref:Uncharacterized protein n=1 Tax=Vitis vinifera TaxID=29760 RepID=A0A438K1W2_VITVI|nr:hypothetical protein CK203_008076 [Vitis vinifera]